MKLLFIAIIALIGLCTVGCRTKIAEDVAAPVAKNASENVTSVSRGADNRKGPNKDEKTDEIPVRPSSSSPVGFYKGCWTSTNGNGMYISSETIQTRNSRKALKYKDVTDETAIQTGVSLLEIEEKDESNELQKYLALKSTPGDEMEARNYFSYEHFKNNTPDGIQPIWVSDDCGLVRPSLNHGH